MQLAIGADAVVRSAAGDVLLVKREDFRVWTIPGGAAERGETPAQAAVRETEEESGVQVAIDELSGVYAFGPAIGLIFVYTAHPVGGAPRTSRESVDVRFFPPGALPRWMLHFARPRLLDALSGQRGTFRYQPYPLWAKVALPAMLRARRLRNRLQGHPEPPLAYRDVVVQGKLCADGAGTLTINIEPEAGVLVWETLRRRASEAAGQPVTVAGL
ncbi:MAG: NUDIX domain-containing protein, partial [Chloroflexi bacterium]|nr:NUDIX domain-containing protein [Chloroflexota bacterium]